MAQIGNVEIDLSAGGYGGDFSIDDTGDLILAQDTLLFGQLTPTATFERMVRVILTNARILDPATQAPISEADDIYHTTFGSSVRALIGRGITNDVLSGIQSRVTAALLSESYILQNPAPTVLVTNGGGGIVNIDVSVTLITGRTVTLPTQSLPVTAPALVGVSS
jgi:hypothetical protein